MDDKGHQNLTDIIKGVHDKLRKSLYLTGDPSKVWNEHVVNDEELRKNYSLAMFKLATEYWPGKECRIEWTYKTCIEYFFGGGLIRSLEKEKRRKEFVDQKENIKYLDDVQMQNIYEHRDRKLRLLDVGSCYNPFSKFSDFSCVAIDLTPATKDVLQCDFLNLVIHTKVKDSILDDSKIFYEESFDVVVFSLVLEYLPSPQQRAVFCFKAWQLLLCNGLCVIITPDSKSLHHNACIIKSWKLAMEKIGFKRIKYDKLTHLHCMAFKKVCIYSEVDFESCKSLSEFLHIPQDFKTFDDDTMFVIRNEEENQNVSEQFLELPNENICLN